MIMIAYSPFFYMKKFVTPAVELEVPFVPFWPDVIGGILAVLLIKLIVYSLKCDDEQFINPYT